MCNVSLVCYPLIELDRVFYIQIMPLPEHEAFNIKFVELVENYKCLYDITIPEYSSKDEQDKAWTDIALKCSSTVLECKTRWKNLRGGLTRYIKKLKEKDCHSTKAIKQFYLWDVMQFVTPYLKSKIVSPSFPSSYYDYDYEDDSSDLIDVDLNEIDDDRSNISIHEPSTQTEVPEHPELTMSLKREKKRMKTESTDNSFESTMCDYMTTDSVEKIINPDLEFLKSILPDMADFSASQKRRFKMGVLQLLEDISAEGTSSRPSSSLTISSSSTSYSNCQRPPGAAWTDQKR